MGIPTSHETELVEASLRDADAGIDTDAPQRGLTKPLTILKRAYATIESNIDVIFETAPSGLTDKELGSVIARHRLDIVDQIEQCLLDKQRVAAVRQLRQTGRSWASVAEHLGLASKQHAWIRYSNLVESCAGASEVNEVDTPERKLDKAGPADDDESA